MNKLLAIFFFLGAIAGFGLSKQSTYQVQDQSIHGEPVGEPRTVHISNGDRPFYLAFGGVCMVVCLYFIAQVRQEDLVEVGEERF